MRSSGIIFFLSFITVGGAWPKEGSSPYQRPRYSVAGCGLGAEIFQDEAPLFAATANAISFNQSFAISSGSSGCKDGMSSSEKNKLAAFFLYNQSSLMKDAARGTGETLDALFQLFNCTDSPSSTFSEELEGVKTFNEYFQKIFKRQFGVFFPKQPLSPVHQSHQLCAMMAQDPVFQNTCKNGSRKSLCQSSKPL